MKGKLGELIAEAEENAGLNGHKLGTWARLNGRQAWTKCRRCKALIVVDGAPVGGGPEFMGSAIEADCPRKEM